MTYSIAPKKISIAPEEVTTCSTPNKPHREQLTARWLVIDGTLYILPLLALIEPETLMLLLSGCSMEQIIQLFKPIAKSTKQQFESYFADFYTHPVAIPKAGC